MAQEEIDFFDALRCGLQLIATQDQRNIRTDKYRKLGECKAPTRTEPVAELNMSLNEFVDVTAPDIGEATSGAPSATGR